MDDRVEWVYPDGASYDTQVGPQALAENVLAAVARDFTEFTATVDEYIDGGDVVCAIGRYGGTASETGTPLDINFVHVLRFAPDGRITRFQEYADTYTMRHALGR